MRVALALALLSGLASAQQQDCSSANSCDTCTGGNEQSGQDYVCSWCEATKECSLAYSKTNADFTTYMSAISSCPNGSYVDMPGACGCATMGADNCDACTSKVECTWVEKGVTTVIFEGSVLGTTISRASTNEFENVCWGGNGFTGPKFNDRKVSGDNFQLIISNYADTWYWGQCDIEGPAFAAILLVVIVVAAFAICCCLYCVVCKSKK